MTYVITVWTKRSTDKHWVQLRKATGAPKYWFVNKSDESIANYLRRRGYDDTTMVRVSRYHIGQGIGTKYDKTLGELYVK